MTASKVLLDTWAWWEILFETDQGRELSERYVENPTVSVHTSALALGEISAKLSSLEDEDPLGHLDREITAEELERKVVSSIRAFSELHDVGPQIAREAGLLRPELREAEQTASLADAIMLVTARSLDAVLISDDGAFAEEPDVQAY